MADTDGLNLERRADLETARETLNRAHVQLGITLERNEVLRQDGVIDAARDAPLSDRRMSETETPTATEVVQAPVLDPEVRRVLENERTGEMSAPFADADQRLAYREAVERDLDADQIDRLRDGDVDVLRDQISDRLDRLYAAKVYLQSDEATANSEAARAVVEEIADREYELHRADLTDGEKERGETH